MHTDPIADLLNRIKNAVHARQTSVTVPYSKIKENIANIIAAREFVAKVEVKKDAKFPELKITLKEGLSKLFVKKVSTPGQRIYIGHEDIKKVRNGLGLAIISTSKGVMTGEEARKQKLGGEFLCEIY